MGFFYPRMALDTTTILIPRSLWRQETCWASQYQGSTETLTTGPTLRSSIRNTSARRRRQQGVLMHSRLLVKVQLWSFIGRRESYYFYLTGPRNCIGMRFALLEAKVALLAVCRRFATIHCLFFSSQPFFSRFTFQAGTKTKEPLRQDPNSQIAWPKGGIWVHMQRR